MVTEIEHAEKVVAELHLLLDNTPNLSVMRQQIADLGEHLYHYFSSNVLEDIADYHPNWHRQVEILKNHCQELTQELLVIENILRDTNLIKNQLTLWLESFAKCSAKINKLLMDAFNIDHGSDHG